MESNENSRENVRCLFCGHEHSSMQCSFPGNIFRCSECKQMRTEFNEPHSCVKRSESGSYRLPVMATSPLNLFQIEIFNVAEILSMDEDLRFNQFSSLLSPATGGLFVLQKFQEHSTLTYESAKNVNFSIYFGILTENDVAIRLRAAVTENGLTLMPVNQMQAKDTINLNTVLVIGLKPRENLVNLRIVSGVSVTNATWTHSAWDVKQGHLPNTNRRCIEQLATICHNCGRGHETEKCEFPFFTIHCRGCLVASCDGSGHKKPCDPINKVSFLRSNVLAEKPITLFELQFSRSEVSSHYMNGSSFVEMNPELKLISGPAECLFTINNSPNNGQSIVVQQTSIKRCNVLIAICGDDDKWRLRFRIAVTIADGVLVFQLRRKLDAINGKFQFPGESDTVAVIGLKMLEPSFYAKLKVHANRRGVIDTVNFNGYTGFIGAESAFDNNHKVDIDVKFITSSSDKRFGIKLYKAEPTPLCRSKRNEASVEIGDTEEGERETEMLATVGCSNSISKEIEERCNELFDQIYMSFDAEEFSTAVQHIDNALKISPDCMQLKVLKVECLALLGQYEDAAEIALHCIDSDPTIGDPIFALGLCFYYKAEMVESIDHFHQALLLQPDHTKAKVMLSKAKILKAMKDRAKVHFIGQNWADSHSLYTQALGIDPLNCKLNATLLYNRALINFKTGQIREAINDCTKALAKDVDYYKAHVLRADCYNQFLMFEKAISDYNAAISLGHADEPIKKALKQAENSSTRLTNDHHFTLGVNKNATTREIIKAYRRLSLIHHPDRHLDGPEDVLLEHSLVMRKLNNARDALLQ